MNSRCPSQAIHGAHNRRDPWVPPRPSLSQCWTSDLLLPHWILSSLLRSQPESHHVKYGRTNEEDAYERGDLAGSLCRCVPFRIFMIVLNLIYCSKGNIAGPFFYKTSQAPSELRAASSDRNYTEQALDQPTSSALDPCCVVTASR